MFKVLGAFIKKDILQLVRYPAQVIFELILPMVNILPTLLVATFFVSTTGRAHFELTTGTSDYLMFYTVSIIFAAFSSVQEQTGYLLIKEVWMGTLEQIWLTPVKRVNLLLGWMFVGLIKSLFNSFAAIGVLYVCFMGVSKTLMIHNLYLMGVAMGLLLIISVAIGMVMCNITLYTRQSDVYIFLITGLIPLLSGAAYPISVLPKWIQWISMCLPTTYIFDLLRHAILGSKLILSIRVELGLAVILTSIACIAGGFIYLQLNKRVAQCGTIFLA